MEKFTDMANSAIIAAKKRATEYGHNYIGTEHILLGLTEIDQGVAAKALADLNVTTDLVDEKIKAILGPGDGSNPKPGFTPRAKRVMEMSLKETLQNSKTLIGTEHILLAIIKEGDGVAVKILADLGVDNNDILKKIRSYLNGGDGSDDKKEFAMAGNSSRNEKGSQLLDKFGRNLTKLAKDGKLDPVIGRKTEVERIIQILSRRTKNNPILIGEPGVGKTAVVEGLAQSIVSGDIPMNLTGKKVYVLDLGAMVAGTSYRGQFEDRLKKVMSEVSSQGDIILFIDEIHNLVGAGNAEGALDASSILKPMLARGELQTIGATTLDEYRKYFEKDSALERRFQPIQVKEPSTEDAIKILQGLRDRYEAHHKVVITDEAIDAAVKLSARYVNDRFLPDKAIDLIDEASARLSVERQTPPQEVRDIDAEIDKAKTLIETASKDQEFEKAATLKGELEGLQ
jgi:ATP-dependent Clp protease ATP-binding subunit ClpC